MAEPIELRPWRRKPFRSWGAVEQAEVGRRVWRNGREDGVGITSSWTSATERARLKWTRPANSHTGPRLVNVPRQRPDTCQHPIRSPSTLKILLAPAGASTHVHDYDIAAPEGRGEDLTDIGEEHGPVHRAVADERRGHAAQAQCAGEGRGLPMTMRHTGPAALASRRAAPQAGHLGR